VDNASNYQSNCQLSLPKQWHHLSLLCKGYLFSGIYPEKAEEWYLDPDKIYRSPMTSTGTLRVDGRLL
jgi:hypothetical protein